MVVGKYSLASHNNRRCQKLGVILNEERPPGQIGMCVCRMQHYPPNAILLGVLLLLWPIGRLEGRLSVV
jgi:hypothetical protein